MRTRAAIIVLILAFFGQLATGSVQLSLTSDEPPHIAHGYLLLTTGDTWALDEHRHPPLLNVLSALPLLLQPERPDVATVPGWRGNFAVFVRNVWPLLGPVERQAMAARVPTMLLAVLLLALVARWARGVAGAVGALLAVAAMAFDPLMVGHSQLATTDVGVALFTVAAIYLAGRIGRQGWSPLTTGLLSGLATGAALASKGSALIVLPVVVGVLAWRILGPSWAAGGAARSRALVRWVEAAMAVTVTALVVLWAAYGFRLEPSTLAGIDLPLVEHTHMVRLILGEKARTAFLAGEVRQGGWLWYFPYAFLVKTPLPLIAMFFGALLGLGRRLAWALRRPELWVYPALHGLTAVASGMNIGLRHLLPAIPFGYIAIATLVYPARAGRWRHILRPAMALLAGWQAVEALSVFPFGIAYFNQTVGGPEGGYRTLVDSNVDWGQSFIALAKTMQQRNVESVHLSYYTWVDPAVYGIAYQPLPPAGEPEVTLDHPYDPAPGTYAISATTLQGVMVADPDLYSWFRHRQPDAQPGYGLLVYEVKPHDTDLQWIAQCGQPAVPLTHDAILTGFGRSDLREIIFDCTQSWIYPSGGATPGWYALHSGGGPEAFAASRLADGGATASFRQNRPGLLPPFDLYVQEDDPVVPDSPYTNPISFGPLSLIGYTPASRYVDAGESVEIETWWTVVSIPERPLSLMLHLGKPEAAPIAVGDGLGVPVYAWQVGDVIVQRHVLRVEPDVPAGAYVAQAGVYWLDTLERWLIVTGPDEGAQSIPLMSIQVAEP